MKVYVVGYIADGDRWWLCDEEHGSLAVRYCVSRDDWNFLEDWGMVGFYETREAAEESRAMSREGRFVIEVEV